MPSGNRVNSQVNNRCQNAGFTLAELVVVIALMLALASVSAYMFNAQRDSSRLDNAGRGISSAIRSARQAAISKGQNHRLVIEIQMVGNLQIERYWVERPRGLNTRGFAAFQGLPPSAWQNSLQVSDPTPVDKQVDIQDVRFAQVTGTTSLAEPALTGNGPVQWYIEFNNRGAVPDRYVVNNLYTDPGNAYASSNAVMVLHLTRANDYFDYNRDDVIEAPYNINSIRTAAFGRDAIGVSQRRKCQTVVLLARTGRAKTFNYGRYDPWQGDEIPSANQ